MRAFFVYAKVFQHDRVIAAARLAAPRLIADGLDEDGRARRVLATPGAGNLRDQTDAGFGLLAAHALTGDASALRRAERIADAIARDFAEGDGMLRAVADDADLPDLVRDSEAPAAWSGDALRFLVELFAVTRERRFAERARKSLEEWAHRLPAGGSGLGEIAGAAYRLQVPPAVFLIDAPPESEAGERLLGFALAASDPWMLVRWIPREERKDVARRFGVELEEEPALYLVWGAPSGALRDEEVVRAVHREAAERAGH
jgi:uncharacterized protein YyaL (SSP411 family)